jgi:ABC-type transporter Mla maintaining outer membrane lipid asymmetry ATPase subunit MlaF
MARRSPYWDKAGQAGSVLLKLLVGLQVPDSGSIRVAGQDITGLDPDHLNEVRKHTGFLFQQAALYDSLTVKENVASRSTVMRIRSRQQKESARVTQLCRIE